MIEPHSIIERKAVDLRIQKITSNNQRDQAEYAKWISYGTLLPKYSHCIPIRKITDTESTNWELPNLWRKQIREEHEGNTEEICAITDSKKHFVTDRISNAEISVTAGLSW